MRKRKFSHFTVTRGKICLLVKSFTAFGEHAACGTALAVGNLEDSLEATATAVIICVSYTLLCYYYLIVVKAIRWC